MIIIKTNIQIIYVNIKVINMNIKIFEINRITICLLQKIKIFPTMKK